ncbi:MAG: hypothetical protein MJ213_00965 [Bacilli bacterium]|nr:hypothetical protein [Bacilli bacterium]
MRKVHLLLLPIMSLALITSCANNEVNFISIGEAVEFAQKNFDPHIGDGYNTEYTLQFNDSEVDEASVYQKHYFNPNEQKGGYTIDKIYGFNLDAKGLEGILYYSRTLSFSSTDLLEFHNTIQTATGEIGYVDNGFIKINNHLGYYIYSDHLNSIIATLQPLLELFQSYFGRTSETIKILIGLLKGFSADQSSFTFHVEFTRFGFVDNLGLKLSMDHAWFQFDKAMSEYVLGDYLAIERLNLNLDLVTKYSL